MRDCLTFLDHAVGDDVRSRREILRQTTPYVVPYRSEPQPSCAKSRSAGDCAVFPRFRKRRNTPHSRRFANSQTTSSTRRRLLAALAALAVLVAHPLVAGVMKIELPPETDSFKPGPGAELANGQCLVCHSVDYVVIQPVFPLKFWQGEVKKMREKYGAQIPAELAEPIAEYLARNYGSDTNVTAATAMAHTTSSGSALSGEAVAQKYGCLACHNVEVKVVGPPYKAIAEKYQNDPTAQAKIAEQIHKGGSGKWGPVIMPPFPMVSDAETRALAEWILSRK